MTLLPLETDRLKIIVDIQYNALVQATNVLEKGISFYLLILAGGLGFLFTSSTKLEPQVIALFSVGISVITLFVLISVGLLTFGIWKGLNDLKYTLKQVIGENYSQTPISSFMSRGIL